MISHEFRQVDVFTAVPYAGNPVAVVHGADDLDDATMASFARWTNLSETTFLLGPTAPEADYRLRIFTPGGELPFAGHPTLGSAHAWLAAGGTPKAGDIVQECGVGLVRIRRTGDRLAFAAPPLRRSGAVDDETLARIVAGLGVRAGDVVDAAWVDNGPGWAGILLSSPTLVAELSPVWSELAGMDVGVAAIDTTPERPELVVRAFAVGAGVTEDPVTGSLNAGLAQWLIGSGRLPASYLARQGAAMRRDGHVYIEATDYDVWVGGDCVTCISGDVTI
jgi:PhzF family phenazine biosynthesis protein